MEIQEILGQLERFGPTFPRDALNEAAVRKEEITPGLLRILENFNENAEQLGEDYGAHIYAIFLLAYFREPKAYPLIVKAVAGRSDVFLNTFFDDIITEDLPRILAAVCDGDLSLIKQLVEDGESGEFVRDAAMRALVVLFAEDQLSRDYLIDYYRGLFTKLAMECPKVDLWSSLVSITSSIHPEELYLEICKAFADGLVDPMCITIKEVDRYLGYSKEEMIQELKSDWHNTLPGNPVKELEWWACFKSPPSRAFLH